MPGPEHDEEFESFLRRRTMFADRAAAADKLEPSRDLDELVIGKARQAIRAPAPLPLYRAPRWALPVALAATLLLTLSVALNVGLNFRPASRPTSRQDTASLAAGADRAANAAAKADRAANAAPQAERPAMPRPPPMAEVAAPAASAPIEAMSANQSAALPNEVNPAEVPGAMQRAAPRTQPEPPNRDALTRERSTRDPKEWLRRIDALRANGNAAQADEELRRFRSAFPAYPLTAPDAADAGTAPDVKTATDSASAPPK